MWTTKHSSTPSRVSAKNIDLRIAVGNEKTVQPATYSSQTELWMTEHQRSRTPSIECSVPSLSPHSLAARDDDVLSQDSDSTAYSTEHTPERNGPFDLAILSPDRYMSQVDGTEIVSEFSGVSKILPTGELQVLSKEPKTPRADGDLIAFESLPTENSSEKVGNDHVIETLPSTIVAIDHVNNCSPIVSLDTIGPLGEQLLAVISKVRILETNHPTVMAADYAELQQRIAKLEADKADLSTRHEALFAIRDADVVNLVNVRTLLAQERREHEALRKLRDDDLENVIQLRNKLAQATWTSSSNNNNNPQSASPQNDKNQEKHRHQSSSTPQSHDLWQAAKTAALEQRVLELESANADLRGKLELSKAQVAQKAGVHSAEHQVIDPVVVGEQKHDAVIIAADEKRRSELDLVFELALRNHERHNTEIKQLKANNTHLRGRLEDKDV